MSFAVFPSGEHAVDDELARQARLSLCKEGCLEGPLLESSLLSDSFSMFLLFKVEPNDAEVAGYARNALNLWQVIVRTAGHMVPAGAHRCVICIPLIAVSSHSDRVADQPRAALDMITRFVNGVPFAVQHEKEL